MKVARHQWSVLVTARKGLVAATGPMFVPGLVLVSYDSSTASSHATVLRGSSFSGAKHVRDRAFHPRGIELSREYRAHGTIGTHEDGNRQ
jgi:hypothetical protein